MKIKLALAVSFLALIANTGANMRDHPRTERAIIDCGSTGWSQVQRPK